MKQFIATLLLTSIATADHTILFATDDQILIRPGTHRVLHQPTAHQQQPTIAADQPWEQAIGYCSVHRDKNTRRYQLWYQSYAGGRAQDPTRRVVVCYAESSDGVHWTKPDLDLFAFNDQQETNIVLIGNGGRSVNYGAAVLYDPYTDIAAQRYKLAYWDFPPPAEVKSGGNPNPGMYVAFSADGMRWKKHSPFPVLPADYGHPGQPPLAGENPHDAFSRPAISDVIDLMYDPIRASFVVYAKTWIDAPDGSRFWKRAVVRTESKNFVQWSTPQLVMAPDEQDGGQLHGAPVFFRHGVYFALLQNLDFGGNDRGGTGNMPGELAVSHDGIRWQRNFREVMFLPVDGDGQSFDAGCLWTNAMPIVHGDQMRFYYGAYPSWHADFQQQPTGIGLRTIALDRIASLRSTDHRGQVTLKARSLAGISTLTLNANARSGAIRVEVLDANGLRMPGYTQDDAIEIQSDATDHVVRWQHKSLTDLPPGRYQIRIHLVQDAELFALALK